MHIVGPPVGIMTYLFNPTAISLAILLLPLAFSGIVMWLWNLTVPEVFGLRKLKYWQAFRLWILVALLLGVVRIL